ncbi:hypothetical protein N9D61_03185 [Planktomarina sp.]|jgi:hypothetical protein|nr:hypothetical protein [Planktomarina sp.]
MPFISSIRTNYEVPVNNNEFEITGGDHVYTMGGYRIHTFTTTGEHSFTIKNINSPDQIMNLAQGKPVEYLVVAGGGAGRGGLGGGGGAGGLRTGFDSAIVGTTPLQVGAGVAGSPGGPGRPRANINEGSGPNNSFFGNIPTTYGGAAGSHREPSGNTTGLPGGSGGGSGANSWGQAGTGITGEGFPGGWGAPGPSHYGCGGGGGAGERGGRVANNTEGGAKGGNGIFSAIDGNAYVYAGGGGGSSHNRPTAAGSGGIGGGGGGSADTGVNGLGMPGRNPGTSVTSRGNGGPGGTNTGGGGGGGDWSSTTGGSGGPGIVIIRYRI